MAPTAAPRGEQDSIVLVFVVIVPALAAVLAAMALLLGTVLVRPATAGLRAVHSRTAAWRWAGLVVGLVAAGTVAALDPVTARGLAVAPSLVAIGVLAGVIVGELRTTLPSRPIRHAPVEVRRVRDYLPGRLASVVLTTALVLAVVLVGTITTGTTDDLGRAGASLVRRCSEGVTQSSGPWPGAFVAVPLAAVVVIGLATAGVALTMIARRPRMGEDTQVDESLRRGAARAVTAACGLLVSLPVVGIGVVASAAMVSIECTPAWWGPIAVGLLVVAAAAVTSAGWCTVALVTADRTALRRDERPMVDATRTP